MQKLTIEHLAAYLPYDLKLCGENSNIFVNLTPLKLGFMLSDWNVFKPILHPFSDLSKEIEINGKKFIPYNELARYLFENDPETFDNMQSAKFWVSCTVDYSASLAHLPFIIIQKFFEWHFDFYGLIPEGLAIDINSLRYGK